MSNLLRGYVILWNGLHPTTIIGKECMNQIPPSLSSEELLKKIGPLRDFALVVKLEIFITSFYGVFL